MQLAKKILITAVIAIVAVGLFSRFAPDSLKAAVFGTKTA